MLLIIRVIASLRLNGPALVGGVLRQRGLAHSVAHDAFAAGVGAPFAAQLADRIIPLSQGNVEPSLNRREAEAHGLTGVGMAPLACRDRKSTRLNSSHVAISYAVFC